MIPANKLLYDDPSGYRISYLDNGYDSETLMLFAPGHFTSDFFTQIEFAPLWENYRVIAPDYPGRGQSTKIDGSDDFTKIASRLERWAKSLECQNIHAIGMSFGTAVITEMLVINPSIFSKITLVTGGEFLSKRADALVKTIFLPALFSEKIRQRYRQFFSNRFSIFRNLPHDGLKELNEQWFAVLDYKLPRKKKQFPYPPSWCNYNMTMSSIGVQEKLSVKYLQTITRSCCQFPTNLSTSSFS